MSNSPPMEISRYDNEVPLFVEREMERLYGSLFSSMTYFRIYGGAENVSTYVARKAGEIVAIFLFRLEGNQVRVINEGMHATREDLKCFVDYALTAFPHTSVVVFHAVPIEAPGLTRPFQRAVCTDDIAVTLDASVGDYLARLGNSTRKNIRRHKNRLERTHPSFQFRAHAGTDVDEQYVRDIIAFNRSRMAFKGKDSSLDDAEADRIIRLVRKCGLVTVAMIDGKVAGGAIVLRLGDCFCSLVNAHDSRYNEHRLGTLCCFMTICECIERKGKRFDLMWGHYDYKTALLGEHRYLYRLVIYRSRLHQLANLPLVAHTAFSGNVLAFRLKLIELANQEGKADAPALAKALSVLRNFRSGLARWLRFPFGGGKSSLPNAETTARRKEKESLPTY